MNPDKFKLLQEWEKHSIQINEVYNLLKVAFDANPDSKAIKPMFKLFDDYTKSVSAIIGDEADWLSWYAWENDFGKREFTAKCQSWKRHRKINSLKMLLKLIEDK